MMIGIMGFLILTSELFSSLNLEVNPYQLVGDLARRKEFIWKWRCQHSNLSLFFKKKLNQTFKKERRMSFPPLQQLTQEKHHFDKKNDFSSKFNLMKAHGACGKFYWILSDFETIKLLDFYLLSSKVCLTSSDLKLIPLYLVH